MNEDPAKNEPVEDELYNPMLLMLYVVVTQPAANVAVNLTVLDVEEDAADTAARDPTSLPRAVALLAGAVPDPRAMWVTEAEPAIDPRAYVRK